MDSLGKPGFESKQGSMELGLGTRIAFKSATRWSCDPGPEWGSEYGLVSAGDVHIYLYIYINNIYIYT